MRVTVGTTLVSLSAALLLGACSSSPPPQPVVAAPPPPPPPAVTGSLIAPQIAAVAPVYSGSRPVYSGSSAAPVLVPGAMRLSASDAMGLLTNNTAVGLTDNGVPYEIYFGSNGVVRFRETNTVEGGTWRLLPDGQVCSQLPSIAHGAENCYVLSRYGNVILYGPANGPAIGSVRVVAGNPQAI